MSKNANGAHSCVLLCPKKKLPLALVNFDGQSDSSVSAGNYSWVRRKVMELLGRLGPLLIVGNEEIVLALFPKCAQETEVMFILGN